jgi:hypothetical protein
MRKIDFSMALMQKQLGIWVAIAAIIVLGGLWSGEVPSGFGGSFMVLFFGGPCIIALMFLLNLMIQQKWWVHLFVGTAFMILLVMSFSIAEGKYHDAFNECVENGEKVRSALQDYYVRTKAYPNTLAELKMNLPGNLIFHPNLLQFEVTREGYLLRFSDNFITFEATHSKAFEANK